MSARKKKEYTDTDWAPFSQYGRHQETFVERCNRFWRELPQGHSLTVYTHGFFKHTLVVTFVYDKREDAYGQNCSWWEPHYRLVPSETGGNYYSRCTGHLCTDPFWSCDDAAREAITWAKNQLQAAELETVKP